MVNIIWLLLLLSGVIAAMLNGNIESITNAVFSSSSDAVSITINIIGSLCLWMGLLKLAEESGLIELLARLAAPIAGWLFPSVPKNHKAISSIMMNLGANILGLGNAATPFGLKAMEELQELNKQKDTASDAMITFMALNTSCITLLPATVISLRVQAGSQNAAEIVIASVLSTSVGMLAAVFLDRFLRKRYQKRGK
ncbi:MAG: spore maturation protein [Firmicutes bacterium]|nr:spore maturation protein [Bacillota bacterium]